ncbi:MAG: AraC family transcriptional regulator [Proteobacteria bacterium]|nr:AraC family transcriptional regulator [Pseudomonadota bacterium]
MQIEDLVTPAAMIARGRNELHEDRVPQLPGLFVVKETCTTEFEAMVYEPVICLILQGGKEMTVGTRTLRVKEGEMLIVSHDLPVSSRIISVTEDRPYLSIVLPIDLDIIHGLASQIDDFDDDPSSSLSLETCVADPALIDALGRYVKLSDNPEEASVLGPMILKEIHFRLLTAPNGRILRQLLSRDSHASRIAKTIAFMQQNYHEVVAVADLSRIAGMSQSSFHEHFRSVTGTTPLQYQKDLRLIAAKNLLTGGAPSVSNVAFKVGYESASQFSREFARKFGVPPRSQISKSMMA